MKNFFSRHFHKLHAKPPWMRNSIGFALIFGGVIGPFLPILGIWMLPLGLILLSADFPWAARLHRRWQRYWQRRQARRALAKALPPKR